MGTRLEIGSEATLEGPRMIISSLVSNMLYIVQRHPNSDSSIDTFMFYVLSIYSSHLACLFQ
jgi:hypothetical protein